MTKKSEPDERGDEERNSQQVQVDVDEHGNLIGVDLSRVSSGASCRSMARDILKEQKRAQKRQRSSEGQGQA